MKIKDLDYVLSPFTAVSIFDRNYDLPVDDTSGYNQLYVGQWYKYHVSRDAEVIDMFVTYVDHTPALCIEVKKYVSDIHEDALQDS